MVEDGCPAWWERSSIDARFPWRDPQRQTTVLDPRPQTVNAPKAHNALSPWVTRAEYYSLSGAHNAPIAEGLTIEPIDLARLAQDACLDKKGTDIRLLDVTGLTIVADYFVICTAASAPQARAIGEHVRETIREKTGRKPLGIEGLEEGWWVLVDFGDILVHVFQEEARKYYALDETWADAQVV